MRWPGRRAAAGPFPAAGLNIAAGRRDVKGTGNYAFYTPSREPITRLARGLAGRDKGKVVGD